MLGDYVRDKDAVTASLLLTEMAAWYQSQGMTLFDALQALYEKYGYYGEKTHNLVMPGLDGLEKMAALMKNLRDVPPTEIAGVAVTARTDYKDGTITDCTTGQVTASELKGSNVLRYALADGPRSRSISSLWARTPRSGTRTSKSTPSGPWHFRIDPITAPEALLHWQRHPPCSHRAAGGFFAVGSSPPDVPSAIPLLPPFSPKNVRRAAFCSSQRLTKVRPPLIVHS